nr:hypothetical protein [Lentilactobacillus otakiensis]
MRKMTHHILAGVTFAVMAVASHKYPIKQLLRAPSQSQVTKH